MWAVFPPHMLRLFFMNFDTEKKKKDKTSERTCAANGVSLLPFFCLSAPGLARRGWQGEGDCRQGIRAPRAICQPICQTHLANNGFQLYSQFNQHKEPTKFDKPRSKRQVGKRLANGWPRNIVCMMFFCRGLQKVGKMLAKTPAQSP